MPSRDDEPEHDGDDEDIGAALRRTSTLLIVIGGPQPAGVGIRGSFVAFPSLERNVMTENKETISTLNSLIETCEDGAKGFRTAAEHVDDGSITSLFDTFAAEREQFAQELRAEVRRLGGQADEGGSMSGAIHRSWTGLKSAVTGSSVSAIVAEAERGEDAAVEAYEEAMKANMPPNVQSVIQRQYTKVKAAHDRVRDLEKTFSR